MSDQAKMAAHWNSIVQGRLGGDVNAERKFVDTILNELSEMVPRRLPQKPRDVPSTSELERLARDGGKGGSWLPDFLAWRDAVERVEAHNASNIESVFGAQRAAAKLQDFASANRCTMFLREVYGLTGELPTDAIGARRVARELTQHHDVIGIKARSCMWQAPVQAQQRSGMGMGGSRDFG